MTHVICNRLFFLFFTIALIVTSRAMYAQTNPITGVARIDLGNIVNGAYGSQINIPVSIDLTGVSATDSAGGSVNAALGNYRIAVSYDNTQIKAAVVNGVINGGTTVEFSNAASAKIITNGTNDLLIFTASQLDNNLPINVINVAQISFDIISFQANTTTVNVNVLDLRTPIVVTGQLNRPIIGGVTIPSQTFNTQINIQASTDADFDGLPDAWELSYTGFVIGNDESSLDFDGDGLLNIDEFLNGTQPNNPDSDGDLVPDGYEVVNNNDPLNINDFPLWITSQPILVGDLQSQYLYQAVVNKPNSTFSLILSPVGMVMQSNAGLITWPVLGNQSGLHNVSISVSTNTEVAVQDFVIAIPGSGDINGDGNINAGDYLLMQQHVLGIRVLTNDQQTRADLYVGNGDGIINIQDLILLGRKMLGN
ncbi:MAG: dockerin type I domain-containing protein [Methylococcales bacterium]